MTPERWQQIEKLCYEALELDLERRDAFVHQACAEDEELRREVESMLAAHDRAGDFLQQNAFEIEAGALIQEKSQEKTRPLPVQEFSHYRILSRIGAGGMGEVWLADDTRLHRQVAIKFLPAEFTADADRLRRFEQEARTASALNHPNIVTVHEIGETEGVHYLVTEFVKGQTLRQRLAEGPLAAEQALEIAEQIAEALAAAHGAGIIHRDIKPENVMLRSDGYVKVLDFGLAKLTIPVGVDPDSLSKMDTLQASHTTPGVILGTPRYMSPEQARGIKVDSRSDIFSLGVVIYELLTGKQPFTGETLSDVIACILMAPPPPLAETAPETPLDLQIILGKLLEKDLARRYQTADELFYDLRNCKTELEISARMEHRSGEQKGVSGSNRQSGSTVQPVTSSRLKSLFGKRSVILLIALTMVGIAAFQLRGWLRDAMRWSRALSGPMTTVPFATYAGQKDFACFSPDGSQIAFAWDGGGQREDGNRDIYIKLIGVGDPVRLTSSPEDDSRPVWSPDNKHIAFLRQGVIYIIPSLPGGVERQLGQAGQGMSWSPDSKILAIASPATKEIPSQLFLISAETGERLQQLTTPNLPNSDDQPAFSPDGKWIAFFRSFGPTRREVFVMPAAGGEPTQLTSDKRQIWGLAWTGDSREIVYATNRGGGMGLWRVRASGGSPERLTVPSLNPTSPAISRQGNRLAYTEVYTDSNIYLYEGAGFADRAAPDKFGEPRAFLTSSREDHSQQFSADGQQIVFISKRTGSEELWVCNRDGTKLRQVTNFDGTPTGTPRWSLDGRWIAFDTRATGDAEVFIVSAEGGATRNFSNSPSSYDATPTWSRDGQWLYFTSNRGGGGENIWKQPVSGGAAVQLTHKGAGEGYESADGQLFYFSKGRGGNGLWFVPVEGGEEKLVSELSHAGYWRSWGVLAQGIYFIAKEDAPRQTVRFFNFATRRITPLVTVGKEALWSHPGLTLSPDGRALLLAQKDHSVNDIMLTENFR